MLEKITIPSDYLIKLQLNIVIVWQELGLTNKSVNESSLVDCIF